MATDGRSRHHAPADFFCNGTALARIHNCMGTQNLPTMLAVRKEDLPFIGSSFNFVGADQGDVAISIFIIEAQPGRGAPLHFHEYDEIVLVLEGESRFVIGDVIRDARPGDILVVKARTPHGFINAGTGILKQYDIHVNPRFLQESVEPTEASRKAGLPEHKR